MPKISQQLLQVKRMKIMGYFYDLAKKYIDFDYDRSFSSPEEQLLCRLDDLSNKRNELIKSGASYRGWTRLADNDIRYADPEYFDSIADTERAIELAVDDLKNKYEIDIIDEIEKTAIKSNIITPDQIALIDVFPLQFILEPLKAA